MSDQAAPVTFDALARPRSPMVKAVAASFGAVGGMLVAAIVSIVLIHTTGFTAMAAMGVAFPLTWVGAYLGVGRFSRVFIADRDARSFAAQLRYQRAVAMARAQRQRMIALGASDAEIRGTLEPVLLACEEELKAAS